MTSPGVNDRSTDRSKSPCPLSPDHHPRFGLRGRALSLSPSQSEPYLALEPVFFSALAFFWAVFS